MAEPALTLAGGRRPGREGLWDITLLGGRIGAVTPAGTDPGGERVELDGRFVVPGLWDEHVHFTQWTLYRRRLDLSRAESAAEAAHLVRLHLEQEGMPPAGPLVGVGFRDANWPDRPSASLLDGAAGDRPVVLVNADLHSVWLSTAAARRLGARTGDDGLVREEEAFRVEGELNELPDDLVDDWAAAAAAEAASRGVVGVVDFEMTWNRDVWLRRLAAGADLLRVQFAIYPPDLDRAIGEGLRTGDPVGGSGLLTAGFLKVLIDGSLGTRTAFCLDPYPEPEGLPDPHGLLTVPERELEGLLRRSTGAGILPAVHAIGDAANRVALDVFELIGTPGRIEHAQLIADGDLPRFARLGAVASAQPAHAPDDRDAADHHWAGRTARAFPLRSLLDAGAVLALGSDAPVAALDPWQGIAAAVHRTADERPPWHPEQGIRVEEALAASTRGRRDVLPGDVADLAVLDRDPLAAPAAELRTMPVAATLLGGRITHSVL
ncbi:amidohydrolase [Naasia sp. SYSU D00948]|uniref:amidohydrolase n=1 Tax=Naasia sp. SYSU D00948 TaxID=2817379 RepID=UPI001B30853A|nr:amidohydrolase family protein [Naasia sp. SYSU D00948]